jgi:hypothetical protein
MRMYMRPRKLNYDPNNDDSEDFTDISHIIDYYNIENLLADLE